jgi:hypothetical protein
MHQLQIEEGREVEHLCRIKLEKRAKLNGTFMCGCWHTRGNCFADCNNKASHVPCSKIPVDVKEKYLQWMKKVRRKE